MEEWTEDEGEAEDYESLLLKTMTEVMKDKRVVDDVQWGGGR